MADKSPTPPYTVEELVLLGLQTHPAVKDSTGGGSPALRARRLLEVMPNSQLLRVISLAVEERMTQR